MTTDIVRIPFHGDEILAVDVDGQPHVVLKPIIERLGLDYPTQFSKLKTRSWATVVLNPTVAEDGKTRNMVTIDVRTLLMLLATVNENRVAQEVHPVLVAYQREVADAIHNYWTRGTATNPRSEAVRGDIPTVGDDPREAAALGALRVINAMGDGISPESREALMLHVWADYSGTTKPRTAVTTVRPDYETEPDLVDEWVAQSCEPYGPGTRGALLYAAFTEWCQERGIVDDDRPTMTHVGRRLTTLGYLPRRHHHYRYRPLRVSGRHLN